jgi:hypothetical protein
VYLHEPRAAMPKLQPAGGSASPGTARLRVFGNRPLSLVRPVQGAASDKLKYVAVSRSDLLADGWLSFSTGRFGVKGAPFLASLRYSRR